MRPSLPSRPATARDLESVTGTLVHAFAGDPVWGGWAFPDSTRATEQRRAFFRFWTRGALRHDAVRVTPDCEAVAVWYPPGQGQDTEDETRQLADLARSLLGAHAEAFLRGCALIEASRPVGTPHYYLSMLGTRVDQRGKGLGMALLRECLALVDAAGMPAFLESTDAMNNPRYERLGFARIGSYALPNGGPTMTMMWRAGRWREPGGGASRGTR